MGLSGQDMTIGTYARALQVLHAVRVGWTPALSEWFHGLGTIHSERLAADLADLTRSPLAPAEPPCIRNDAEAWGVRYVLEGSALGGQVILRDAAALGLSACHGARYFAGNGQDTGRHWTQFLLELDLAAQTHDPAAIECGAVTAFSSLHDVAVRHA